MRVCADCMKLINKDGRYYILKSLCVCDEDRKIECVSPQFSFFVFLSAGKKQFVGDKLKLNYSIAFSVYVFFIKERLCQEGCVKLTETFYAKKFCCWRYFNVTWKRNVRVLWGVTGQ